MKPNNDNRVCPVTGRPLPDGHTLHPVLGVQVRKTARRIPSLYEDALRHIGGGSKTVDGTPTGIRRGDRVLWSLLPDLQLIEDDVVEAARLTGMQGPATIISAAKWISAHAQDFTRQPHAERAWYLLRSSARRLATTIDRQPSRHLTICPTCGQKTYTSTGRITIQCGQCDTIINLQDANAELREQGQYTWMRKTLALEYVHMLTGIKLTNRQLKHLRDKGQVTFQGTPRRAHYQPAQIIHAIAGNNRDA